MREVAGSGIAAVPIPLASIVAQGFAPVAVATFLSFPFAFTFPFPDLACRGSILVNLPFFPFAGGISSTMPLGSAAVAAHLPRAGLGVSIHDGEARVSSLPPFLIHLITPPLC